MDNCVKPNKNKPHTSISNQKVSDEMAEDERL